MRLIFIALVIVTLSPPMAEAGLGSLLGKGFRFLAKGSDDVAKAGAKGVAVGAGSVAKRGAAHAGRASTPAISASSKALAKTATPIVDHLGVGGLKAMKHLSPAGTQKLAVVSADLAKNPYRTEWLHVIGRYGDAAADFLWRHKGSVAVGVGATVAVLKPEAFLKATGQLAETTIRTGTTEVIKPVVSSIAEKALAPVAKEIGTRAAVSFPWRTVWFVGLLGLVGTVAYRFWHRHHAK